MNIVNTHHDGFRKVAVITGSGRENGIGAGIATALARNGAAVVLNYVSDSSAPRSQALAKKIRGNGGRVAVVKASIETPEGAQHLAQEVLRAFETDHIDILVNNAGCGFAAQTLDTKPEELCKTLDVNLKGPIYVAQAVVPHMPRGGSMINITSTANKFGSGEFPVYAASKAALDCLTWSWAKEWGRSRGLTVNSVAPGPVATDICPPEYRDVVMGPHIAVTRAAERFGTIEEIGDAVLFLASDKARWITGQFISTHELVGSAADFKWRLMRWILDNWQQKLLRVSAQTGNQSRNRANHNPGPVVGETNSKEPGSFKVGFQQLLKT
ncbi:hypothetical protein BX600DRAFT_518106 [Xylariales sp. PMI_506]|nr:hypothetical protein BX600DRAFT_518106 [Xylariales sp. PMI_506]